MTKNTAFVFQCNYKTFLIVAILYDIATVQQCVKKLFNDDINVVYDEYDENIINKTTLICLNDKYYQILPDSIENISIIDIVKEGFILDTTRKHNFKTEDNENDNEIYC